MDASEPAERGGRPHLGPLVAWCFLAVAQAALGLGSYLSDAELPSDPLFRWEFVRVGLIQFALLVGLTLMIAYSYGQGLAGDLGMRRFASRWVWIALGVIFVSLIVGGVMEVFTNAAKEQGLSPTRWHPDRVAPFAASAVVVVIIGPFAEELFFRGLGVRVLAWAKPAVAIAVTAVAFALAHGVPAAFPTLVVFGAGLAWVRLRSDSIWPGYLAHATYNALALALAALSF